MFTTNSYFFIILNISGGLLTLLGAVGIFISLIIQRRVERLQDILEELLDLSYAEEKNTGVKIQKLLYKYQMQYSLPGRPIKAVLTYIKLTVYFVVLLWAWLLIISFRAPFQWLSLIYLTPMLCVSVVMFFYRQLIKNAIDPVGNHLFNSIIPEPRYLRSIAFLSSYVNVCVKSIILQARPLPVLRQKNQDSWEVILKEELPFDDYHYFICLFNNDSVSFTGYGHIWIELNDDPVTGKPRPTSRNLNIPLGNVDNSLLSLSVKCCFLVFPKGEKHPIQFLFSLEQDNHVYCAPKPPEVTCCHLVTYRPEKTNILQIIKNCSEEIYLSALPEQIPPKGQRLYASGGKKFFQKVEEASYED